MPINSGFKNFDLTKITLKGSNLIEASAGTGKTYNICWLYLKILLDLYQSCDIKNILVITFTKAATEELKIRIKDRLTKSYQYLVGDANYRKNLLKEDPNFKILDNYDQKFAKVIRLAILDFDQANIFTIHGFCKKVIEENSFETDFFEKQDILEESEDSFIEEYVKDFYRNNLINIDKNFLSYLMYNHKLSIDKLITILKDINNRVRFKLSDKVDLQSALSQLNSLPPIYKKISGLFDKLSTEWQKDKDKIIDFLDSGDVDRRTFKSEKIPQISNEFDDYINQRPVLLIYENIKNLSISKLETKLNKTKGAQLIKSEVFNIIEKLQNNSDEIEKIYNNLILAVKYHLSEDIHKKLKEKKHSSSLLSFNDILFTLHSSLYNSEFGDKLSQRLSRNYKAALIDEFQDTDPIQYEIFKKIFSSEDNILFLIGDPKQSIYSFRGADIFTYMRAAKEVDNRYTITNCYRSEKEIIDNINNIFSVENPFVYEDIKYHQITSLYKKSDTCSLSLSHKFKIYNISNKDTRKDNLQNITTSKIAESINNIVAENINKFVENDRPLQLSDIAILVRSHSEAEFYKNALKNHGINSIIYSEKSVFETEEGVEVKRVLEAIADPFNRKKLFSALITPIFNKDISEINRLNNDESELEIVIKNFIQYQQIFLQHGFIKMFSTIVDNHSLKERLISEGRDRKLINILHIQELIHKEIERSSITLEGVLKWLNQRLNLQVKSSDYEIRLESDKNAVQIVTIHKSKGLQYLILFFPCFSIDRNIKKDDPKLYHDTEDKELSLSFMDSQDLKALNDERLSENIRLFYVAVTRAVLQCNIFISESFKNEVINYLDILNNLKSKKATVIENIENIDQISDPKSTNYLKDQTQEEEDKNLIRHTFNKKIIPSYKISSFTKLAFKSENSKIDEIDTFFERVEDIDTTVYNIFTFPRGAKTGIFLHNLIENINFTMSDEKIREITEKKLTEFDFDNKWSDTISQLIRTLSNLTIKSKINGDSNILMKDIDIEKQFKEVEFYLKFKSEEEFINAVKNDIDDDFKKSIERLDGAQLKTFLNGSIDMLFEYKDKFYIVDWKSNYLGDSTSHYCFNNLKSSISDALYFLQYYIYSTALYRKIGSDYSKFGGVFYIFLRGIGEDSNGVFFDKPSQQFFEAVKNV